MSTRLFINTVGGRVSLAADTRNRLDDTAHFEAVNLTAMLWGDQSVTADFHPHYGTLLAMVKGYLHTLGERDSSNTDDAVNLQMMISHMGSASRPINNPEFMPMLTAAFVEVEVEKDERTVKRYRLKHDLSKVYDDFTQAQGQETQHNLFSLLIEDS